MQITVVICLPTFSDSLPYIIIIIIIIIETKQMDVRWLQQLQINWRFLMIPWGKVDHHKCTQLKYISCRFMDMLDSLHPCFPHFLLPSPSYFHFLSCFLLSCLLSTHLLFFLLPISSLPRGLPAWLSRAPCLSLVLSLWGGCCPWAGTSYVRSG